MLHVEVVVDEPHPAEVAPASGDEPPESGDATPASLVVPLDPALWPLDGGLPPDEPPAPLDDAPLPPDEPAPLDDAPLPVDDPLLALAPVLPPPPEPPEPVPCWEGDDESLPQPLAPATNMELAATTEIPRSPRRTNVVIMEPPASHPRRRARLDARPAEPSLAIPTAFSMSRQGELLEEVPADGSVTVLMPAGVDANAHLDIGLARFVIRAHECAATRRGISRRVRAPV